MSSGMELSVHSIHVNIGVGDCSIHLLVDDEADPPVIYRAVLIDGGIAGKSVQSALVAEIEQIEQRYDFAATEHFDGNLRFDSVIITHWDIDHWGGIRDLLSRGLEAQLDDRALTANTDLSDSIEDSVQKKNLDKVSELVEDVKGFQCKYFKYDTMEPTQMFFDPDTKKKKSAPPNKPAPLTPAERDELLTTFYVPYINGQREDNGNANSTDVGGTKTNFKSAARNCQVFTSNDDEVYDETNNANTMTITAFLSYKIGKRARAEKRFRLLHQCKLVAYYDHYLGVEVFYNNSPAVSWSKIKDPGQLVKQHGLAKAQGPRMFIVAGDQVVIGQKSLGQGAANVAVHHKPGVIEVVDSKDKGALGARVAGERKTSNQMNSASIATLIISSTSDTPKKLTTNDYEKAFQMCHYMAGDALWDVDDAICNWLTNDDNWERSARTKFMKLSHHGAYDCNPISLIDALSPDYVISPTGDSKTYCHPRMEILFYIHALNDFYRTSPTGVPIELLCYNWPIWFVDIPTAGITPNLEPMYEPTDLSWNRKKPSPVVVFLKELQRTYKTQASTLLEEWWNLGLSKPTTDADKELHCQQMYSILKPVWKLISRQSKNVSFGAGEITSIKAIMQNDGGKITVGVDTWRSAAVEKTKKVPGAKQGNQNRALPSSNGLGLGNNKGPHATLEGRSLNALNTASGGNGDNGDTSVDGDRMIVDGPISRKRSRSAVAATQRDKPSVPTGIQYKTARTAQGTQQGPGALSSVARAVQRGEVKLSIDDDGEGGHFTYVAASDDFDVDEDVPTVSNVAKVANSTINSDLPLAMVSGRPENHIVARMVSRNAAANDGPLIGPMFLCGSDYGDFAPDFTTDGYYEIPLEGGLFKQFVSYLGAGCLKLSSLWAPGAGGEAVLAVDDTWMASLLGNGLGISAVTLNGSNDGHIAHVTAVSANLKLADAILNFSSTVSQSVSVGTVPPPVSALGDAISSKYNLLSLGIQLPVSPSFKVSQVLAAFNPHWPDQDGLGSPSLPGLSTLNEVTAVIVQNPGSRNSLTFRPDMMNTSWLRLSFQLDPTTLMSAFQTAFPFLQKDKSGGSTSEIAVTNVYLTGLKESLNKAGTIGTTTSSLSLSADITCGPVSDEQLVIHVRITFDYGTTKFIITFHPDDSKDKITRWMARFVGLGEDENTSLQPHSLIPNTSDISFELHKVIIVLNNPGSAAGFSIQMLSVCFEIDVYETVFTAAVNWSKGSGISLDAQLWTELPPEISEYSLVPYYEPDEIMKPSGKLSRSPSGTIDFTKMVGPSVTVPPGKMNLDLELLELRFKAKKNASGTTLEFYGSIGSLPPKDNAEVPKIVLEDLSLFISYSTNLGYDFEFHNTTLLIPRRFPEEPAAGLQITVELDDSTDTGTKTWRVAGVASNLYFSTLFELFDPDASHAVMDILEKFYIPILYVEWDYSPGQADLSVGGTLVMGPFELDLDYHYTSSPPPAVNSPSAAGSGGWELKASLGTKASKAYRLKDLIEDLVTDPGIHSAIEDVPFVGNIVVPAATPTLGVDPPIQFYLTKQKGGPTVMWLMISITTDAGTLSFTFVQLQTARTAPATGVSTKDATAQGPQGFKRIIRVALDKLPSLPNIPVVGQIDQPFDSIDYLYVSDTTTSANTAVQPGFTTTEMTFINGTMGADKIPFRASSSSLQSSSPGSTSSTTPEPPVLLPGHHFVVVAENVVILDHIFGGNAKTTTRNNMAIAATPKIIPGPRGKAVVNRVDATQDPSPSLQGDSGSTMGPLNKSLGLLSIQSVGLQCKNGYLYILVTATIALGPIQLTLIGFGVGIKLDALHLNEIKNLKVDDFSVILSGMSVYFNAPPVLIAGVFVKEERPGYEAYKGGLAVSILPYTLLAVGAYENNYAIDLKSVFVFARLDGPLFTLEFAEISGVEAGFGYNYDLRSPLVSEVQDFPLVHGVLATQQNPMDTLTQFDKFNHVARDSLWFAVGFKVDAFEILTVDAAAVIQISPTSVKIAIVAIASASMPPMMTKREEMFVYVELGIVASLDILGGTLQIGAQLTPNSFVLYPDCHLTGGFAMCYWFKGSPYEGDWVFTIGGYHPAFKPPSYYPVMPRLGINWNLSDVLTILGEAYFAITPKACMGGGRLLAVFNAGPIYAHFEAWAGFLMNFKPFYFIADIGVSVGVGFHCDIGIIHINISVDINASLHLQGPQFGGVVHVDLKIHNFAIYFGDQNQAPPALTWDEFLAVVQQQRDAQASTSEQSSSALVVVALEEGSANEKTDSANKKTGDKWFVRAGSFKFRVECKVPIDDMIYTDEVVTWSGMKQSKTTEQISQIYARLMHTKSNLSSTLNVDIQYPKTPDAAENAFQVTPLIRQMPNSLWAAYDESEDPTLSGNKIDSLLSPSSNPTTRPLLTGFTFASPKPRIPSENIPEFNAVLAMSEGVFQDGGDPNPTKRARPLLPPNPDNVDERPNLPPTPPEQDVGRPAARGKDPWGEVVEAWTEADDGKAQGLVDAWAGLFGWGVKAPDVESDDESGDEGDAAVVKATTATPTSNISIDAVAGSQAQVFEPLTVGKPKKILGIGKKTGSGLDAFLNYYVGCPFVTATA